MTFRTEHLAEGVTLILGDCREVLPTLGRFDAVVTDPPYGIGADEAAHKNKGKWGWKYYGDTSWDRERPPASLMYLLQEISDIQIVWGGHYFTDVLPPQWLIWDKGQRDFSLADFEVAWSSQQLASRIISYSRALALQDGKEHPTQKPLEVMKWCLERLPVGTRTILDPFMGSGTTGVAAALAGKHFTGVEVNEAYFEIAKRRISDALKQPDFFIEKPKPLKQEAMEI